MKDRILIVEDDKETRLLLKDYLNKNGYDALAAGDGTEMWSILNEQSVDLIVLDLMLPGDDGLTLCRTLRAKNSYDSIPIIMLTARGGETDRIIGLEMGADDYLPKPYNPRELLARIKSVLRRTRLQPREDLENGDPKAYQFSGWHLSIVAQQLTAPDGVLVPLTRGEFDLLLIFLSHPDQVMNRDALMGLYRNREATPFDRGIDVQIGRLRKRLREDPKNPRILRTVWGQGYILNGPVEHEQ
ncbi:MAG: response regulator [Magnetococcales bacterium]|nr:response regulator [Magnetococcales bacterium]